MPPVPFPDSESEDKRKDDNVMVRDVSTGGLTTYNDSDSDTDTRSDVSSRDRISSVDSAQSTQSKKVYETQFEQIDRTKMTMSELINVRLPKGENPLTSIWKDISTREAEEKAVKDAEEEVKQTKKDQIKKLIEEAKEKGETLLEEDFEDDKDLPPLQVEIGDDGKIVINQKSLEVTREGNVIRETVEEDNEEITFGRYEDHKVNHNSFSRRKRAERKSWKGNDDEMFYAALRRVGTDFDMMAKILPGYTRDQLKRKFKREEKARIWKIDLALSHSTKMILEEVERPPSPEPPAKKVRPDRKEGRSQKRSKENTEISKKRSKENTETRKRRKEYKKLPDNNQLFNTQPIKAVNKSSKSNPRGDDLAVIPLNSDLVISLKARLEDQGIPFPTAAPRSPAPLEGLTNLVTKKGKKDEEKVKKEEERSKKKVEAARKAHQKKRASKAKPVLDEDQLSRFMQGANPSDTDSMIVDRVVERVIEERTITKGLVKTNINRKRELSERSERRAREEQSGRREERATDRSCSTPKHSSWDMVHQSELDEVDKILQSPDTRFSVDEDVVTLEDNKQSSLLPELRYSPSRNENTVDNDSVT